MKKWLFIALALLVALVLAGFSFRSMWNRPIEPGVTEENFDRLHEGMTYEEFVAILGEPKETKDCSSTWLCNGSRILVSWSFINPSDKVACMGEMQTANKLVWLQPPPKSLFERVRDFLGLNSPKEPQGIK